MSLFSHDSCVLGEQEHFSSRRIFFQMGEGFLVKEFDLTLLHS